MMRSVCVFCGANAGASPGYGEAARRLGVTLVRRGLRLVYGGGRVGMMGRLADAVLAAGGEAVGVIPRALMARELAHTGLTHLHVVDSMHERKALMNELSDAFIALPGGYGTLEEFCEVLTWAQLGIHRKPCGLLDAEGFFQPLRAFIDHAVAEGFVRPEHRALLLYEREADRLLDALAHYQPPPLPAWMRPPEA